MPQRRWTRHNSPQCQAGPFSAPGWASCEGGTQAPGISPFAPSLPDCPPLKVPAAPREPHPGEISSADLLPPGYKRLQKWAGFCGSETGSGSLRNADRAVMSSLSPTTRNVRAPRVTGTRCVPAAPKHVLARDSRGSGGTAPHLHSPAQPPCPQDGSGLQRRLQGAGAWSGAVSGGTLHLHTPGPLNDSLARVPGGGSPVSLSGVCTVLPWEWGIWPC